MKLKDWFKSIAPGSDAKRTAEALLAQETVTDADFKNINARGQMYFAQVITALRNTAFKDSDAKRRERAQQLMQQANNIQW